MAVHTLPLTLDLVVYSRTSLFRQYRWKPDGTNPVDMHLWTAEMLIGPQGGTAVLTLTDGAGITLDAAGLITISLTAAQVADLPTSRDLYYQLDLIDTDDYRFRFVRGRVTVVVDVEPA